MPYQSFPALRMRNRGKIAQGKCPKGRGLKGAAAGMADPPRPVGERREVTFPPDKEPHVPPDVREAIRPNVANRPSHVIKFRHTKIAAAREDAEMRAKGTQEYMASLSRRQGKVQGIHGLALLARLGTRGQLWSQQFTSGSVRTRVPTAAEQREVET